MSRFGSVGVLPVGEPNFSDLEMELLPEEDGVACASWVGVRRVTLIVGVA